MEYVPESFKVIRHVRPKFACAGCERVVEAPAPSRPIERGLAGPALLAHVLVSKFCDHQPLYRQSEIYARQGVEIERSTLAGWVGAKRSILISLVLVAAIYIAMNAVLLTLLYLGVRGIRVGPAAPAFLSPGVFEVLKDRYDLKLTGSSPTADLKAALQGAR